MYAIVETGGKQYRVKQGDVIAVEKLNIETGSDVDLKVLALGKDGDVLTGDAVKSAKVTAEVVEHGKGKKVIIFKYKPKKNYRKKQGHRQPYTKLSVKTVEV